MTLSYMSHAAAYTPEDCFMELETDCSNYIDPHLRHYTLSNATDTSSIQRYLKDEDKQPYSNFAAQYQYPSLQSASITHPFPYDNNIRDFSPTPSYGKASIYSSSQSPQTDFDLSSEMNRSISNYQTNTHLWSGDAIPAFVAPTEIQDVTDTSQVSEEPYFHPGPDPDMSFGHEAIIKQENIHPQHYQNQPFHESYNAETTSASAVDDEADAEFEDDEESGVPFKEQSDDDGDYNPRPTRKQRRSIRNVAGPRPATNRVVKNKRTKAKGGLQCQTCSETFKDTSSLQKHLVGKHPSSFTCVYAFAGCESTFSSKNEWKRHTISQHLGLQYWQCSICNEKTHKPSAGPATKRTHFNRKDLFTQHLRRMHAPLPVKHQNKQLRTWDERIKKLQDECKLTRREPPSYAKCPVMSCGKDFHGEHAWDEHMEHVGKHVEQGLSDEIQYSQDDAFVSWSVKERIIHEVSQNGEIQYILAETRSGKSKTKSRAPRASSSASTQAIDVEDDADAYGEDE